MQVGVRLRHLFATILVFCEPSQPDILWREFRHHICDDLRHHLWSLGVSSPSDDEVWDYGLYLLERSSKSIDRRTT
ncbi:hypothetical protein C8J56DRAFT_973363 [Mycena floridula]|nr:hypothetical protein C8J56DRAFT_973363 [Mycena floridula]